MYSYDFETNTGFGEIKTGLSAIRTVRDMLVKLVQGLVHSPTRMAYLVLVDPRVTAASLEKELNGLKAAMRPEIAERLVLVIVENGEMKNIPANIPLADLEGLRQQIDVTITERFTLPSPDKKSEVLRFILLQWVRRTAPMTSEWISRTVGCSYRTVAAAIKSLGRAIERTEDRRVQLKYFPVENWARFMAVSERARASIYYADRSNQPRSVESLVRRLQQQTNRPKIAIGGVMGAKRHYPELDMVSAPRLDICLHAPGKHADLGFMEQLDPGLKRDDSPNKVARVALHFLRRKESLFERDETGIVWADPVECLADLSEARLDNIASEFQRFLSQRGEQLSGKF